MKIYFTCSTAEFQSYEKSYFQIRNVLIEEGHVLTRDWLPHTAEWIKENKTDITRDIKSIYRACVDAIHDADLVIVEDTVSNFSTGHQITLALQYRRPTLVLWKGKKHRQFQQMFIHGIESDILQISEYTDKDLDEIIKTFIKKYGNANEKNRFHLVLNQVERNYLDWAQFQKHNSRTNVIRQALRDEIEGDEEYQKYLRGG